VHFFRWNADEIEALRNFISSYDTGFNGFFCTAHPLRLHGQVSGSLLDPSGCAYLEARFVIGV